MHCASCASIIEKTIRPLPGIASVAVNYGTESMKISFDASKMTPEQISVAIAPLGYTLVVSAQEPASLKDMELEDMRMKVLSVLPLAVFSILIMGWDFLAQVHLVSMPSFVLKELFHHLLPIFATYTLFVVGKPYLQGVYRFLRYGKANMDTLIGIGTSAAFLYSFVITAFEDALRPYLNVEHSYYDVTIVVIAFISLGKYLEARAKKKTGGAIAELLHLQAKTAFLMRDGHMSEVSIDQLVVGDVIMVKPGGNIPVDGVIVEGGSFVNESMITGEPMPTEKHLGDKVVAGTMNTTGAFTFRATQIGADTLLAKIIKMVQEAQGSRAPIQALADQISAVFVPIVLVLACTALATWLLIGIPLLGFAQALSYGLVSFVGVLVIACPCALGLATPTAIIVGVGRGAKEGILIKDAASLEMLHKVDTIVLDKTGTITKGSPEVTRVSSFTQQTTTEIMSILAALERVSEHPIASAIMNYATLHKMLIASVTGFESIKGKGVKGVVDGKEYFAGNVKLMEDLDLKVDVRHRDETSSHGKTQVFLANKTTIIATVFISDALKPEAVSAVRELHALRIKVVMLTGDTKEAAEAIGQEAGIDEVIAEMMPEDKLQKIEELQALGHVVAMAGDGVNDAPALAKADVGIAMGTGTDVAIETAGITLLHGDISKLVKAIRLSKMTMRGIKQNLFWAFFYNVIGIPLASGLLYPLFGWMLNPVFAGIAMAFSSVSVVSNSLRLSIKKL